MSRYDMNKELKKGSLSRRDFIKLFGRGAKVGAGITLASALLPERAFATPRYGPNGNILLEDNFDDQYFDTTKFWTPYGYIDENNDEITELGEGKIKLWKNAPTDDDYDFFRSILTYPTAKMLTVDFDWVNPSLTPGYGIDLIDPNTGNNIGIAVQNGSPVLFRPMENYIPQGNWIESNNQDFQLRLLQYPDGSIQRYINQGSGFQELSTPANLPIDCAVEVFGDFTADPLKLYKVKNLLLEEIVELPTIKYSSKIILIGSLFLLGYHYILSKDTSGAT